MDELRVICPKCRRPILIPMKLAENIRSILQDGCDDCVWKVVHALKQVA